MKNILVSLLFVPSIVLGCMMPAAQPQGSTAGPAGSSASGGGVSCDAYCSHQTECGVAEYQPCLAYCSANANDGYFAQQASDLSDDSCDELQAKRASMQQGDGGGGGGVGGNGSGCRASAARGGAPVQDCPAMQSCCGGGCHAISYCSMPSGR